MTIINLLWLTAFCFPSKPVPAKDAKAAALMEKVISAVNNITSIQYEVSSVERMRDGKMQTSAVRIKSETKPFKVYYYVLQPDKGVEILYKSGDKNATLNPNGFPYFNLRLDPNGYLMRKGQHHSIADNGWQGIADRLQLYLNQASEDKNIGLSFDNINYNGDDCLQITVTKKDFSFDNYSVQPGEDILSIAKERRLNAYMILCVNKKISWYHDVSAGERILLPNSYCREFSLIVNKKSYLPLQLECKDDKGVFEKYTFKVLQINPAFQPGEFTTKWKAYNF